MAKKTMGQRMKAAMATPESVAAAPPMAIVWEAPACPACEARFDAGVVPAGDTDGHDVTCVSCGATARARFWRRQDA